MSNPRVRKHTFAQREEILIEIADMHVRGAKQREIAARFNVSQSQISKDIKAIRERWAQGNSEDLQAVKARLLAKYGAIERAAWKSFEVSQKPREVRTQERIETLESAEHEGKNQSAANGRRRASMRTEERAGDPRWLKVAKECADAEGKLYGVDRPSEESKAAEPEQIKYIIPKGPEPRTEVNPAA